MSHLAKAHVICQDAALLLGVLPEQEADSIPLILSQVLVDAARHFHCDLPHNLPCQKTLLNFQLNRL